MRRMVRCEGSHKVQDLAWGPTEKDGYPGAAVCLGCDAGIQALKGTAKLITIDGGQQIWVGKLRVHTREAE